MYPNIFIWVGSYNFRNIIILPYWQLENWWMSFRTILLLKIISKLVNYGELLHWTSNILHLDEWRRHIYTYAYLHTHTHTQTHTHTNTHIHTHARAYIQKQGVTLHILVSSISSEGVRYHHSDVSPDGTTARVHVTLWTDCIAMSMMCCKREPFMSFGNIKCLSTNFVGVTNWIFLKKVLSLEIVIEKTAGKPRSGRIIKKS